MKNINEVLKSNLEEFDKRFVHNKKAWIPEVHATAKSLTDFLTQSQQNLISAFKEMVEERIKNIFIDYPDTIDGNRARYENTCRIGELRELLSSLTEEIKI